MRRSLRSILTILILASMLGACANSQRADDASSLLGKATAEVDRTLSSARKLLVELAALPSVRNHDVAGCTAALASRAKPLGEYSGFGVSDAAGDIWCLSIPITAPTNIVDRAYFQIATGTGDFAVGDYQISRVSKAQGIGAGYPVAQTGKSAPGIVLAAILLSKLMDRLASAAAIPAGGDLIVTDSHGTVLARLPDRSFVGRNLSGTSLVKAMLENRTGSQRFEVGGVRRTYTFGVSQEAPDGVHIAVGLEVA